ncbi:right-handed parallel beta-helix repeat-containing protein, partial [Myxococcota bacterium]|nr:right-handed parallel beta-helix repeat-containing protein [Myxococcota bacterium]
DVGADAAFLGDAACAPLGAACPGAPLEAPVTPRRVSFVDATATGGDGTRARPFSTIGAALDAARSTGAPALILVEPGRYDEHVVIDGDVVLRGACAAATTIGPGPGSAAITVTAGPASIEALSVDGAIELSAGATAALWAILIRGTGSTALSIAPSASAGASELVVRGSWALGVHVEGALSLDRAIVDGPETGLSIAGATSELRATHLLVRGPAAPSSERIAGIEVDDGAHLALSESFVVRAVRAGVLASTGATVELTDVTIAQTRSAVDWSAAVLTGAASNVTITRALLEDNAATGLSVGAAARATILDSAILGSRALATFPTSGAAITTAESSTTTIERVVLEHNDAHGILAYRATVRARDVSVLGPAALVGESAGAIAVEGVQLDVERLYARDLRERGIFAIRATGTLVDLDVESVTFQRRSSRGAMLELERGTRFTVERLRGGEAENCVVAVDLGTELVLRDLLLSNPSNGGVLVRDGAHLVLERAEIRRPMDGLSVIGGDEGVPLDSTAIVRDLTIAYAATGLEVLHGPARVDVERFAIVDGDDYGLRQEGGALVDLRDGRLHGSSVGVQIAKTGYDLARVADRVRFEDVRTPFVVLE